MSILRQALCVMTILLLVLPGLAACNKQNKRGAQAPVDNPFISDEDLLLKGLSSELPDEQQFALYFISHFGLETYERQLQERAVAGDLMSAVVLASVHKDSGPLLSLADSLDAAAYQAQLLGVVQGMSSAGELPEDVWDKLLGTKSAGYADLIWNLSLLDQQDGGPLVLSANVVSALEQTKDSAIQRGDLYEAMAVDALLGNRAGRSIDWPAYAEQSPKEGSGWAVLYRHAPADVWTQRLAIQKSKPEGFAELIKVAAELAPAGTELPLSREEAVELGLEIEFDCIEFVNQRSAAINTDSLSVLLGQFQSLAAENEAEEGPSGAPRHIPDPQWMSQLFRYATYAAVRSDLQSLDMLLGATILLGEDEVNAILATIERLNPAVVTDPQLAFLGESKDRSVGYWMLFGWPEREAVQQSQIVRLIWLSPNQENRMLFQAYSYWLEQNGLIPPEAPSV